MGESIGVREIENVRSEGLDPNYPAPSSWRVEISGLCFDFDEPASATRLADLISGFRSERDALLKCAEALKAFVDMAEQRSPGISVGFAITLLKKQAKEALALLSQAQNCKPDRTLTASDARTALPLREGETT